MNLIKTNNSVNIELHKSKNSTKNIQTPIDKIDSRYGITKNLIKQASTTDIDRRTTRNQLIPDLVKNYKISRINIDSRNRNIDPKNIIEKYITLQNNPLIFSENNNILEIIMPLNHNINTDDNITISNVKSTSITLKGNTLTFKKNSNYIYVNHENHNFIGDNNVISISGVIGTDTTGNFINNIPLSRINTIHNVILIKSNEIIDNNNYILDLGMYSDDNIIYSGNYYDINILTINGVNIKYINASYPIDNDVNQGYHKIIYADNTRIKIKLSVYASKTNTTGGTNILVGKIISTISGYPYPDYYKVDLKKTYYKVKKIRLVSTEIPNTEMLIKNVPTNLKNNVLYWQIQDDGDNVYSINITPGNYDHDSLRDELITKISTIKRVFGNYITKDNYYEYCIPQITINKYNNIFSFQILSKIYLSKNIIINNEINNDNYKRIIITHPYHNLNVGDNITISGAVNVVDSITGTGESKVIYYIPTNIINNTHKIEKITGINTYIIKLPKYNSTKTADINDDTIINGGNAVEIIYPLSVRLLFNYKDTIGNVLGFKNIGVDTSITLFSKTLTNQISYINDTNLNSVGTEDTTINELNFNTYPYILMVSEIFNSNINIKDSSGVFSKLFLTGQPGTIIYDQYVQITDTIQTSISNLNDFIVYFLTPDGNRYNFNGHDHSYTLEIYEEIEENN